MGKKRAGSPSSPPTAQKRRKSTAEMDDWLDLDSDEQEDDSGSEFDASSSSEDEMGETSARRALKELKLF